MHRRLMLPAFTIVVTIASISWADRSGDQHEAIDAGSRTISVTARFLLPDGDPGHPESDTDRFPELPFSLYLRTAPMEREEIAVALSREDGVVRFENVEVPVEHDRVVFGTHNVQSSTRFDEKEQDQYWEQYTRFFSKFYWPQFCRGCRPAVLKLEDGKTSYELELEIHHRVVLTGLAEHADGEAVQWGMTWARYANSYGGTSTEGRLSRLTVPKGRANEVFVIAELPVVVSRLIHEDEVMEDVDLGRISIPSLERTVEFDGVVTEMRQFNETRVMAVTGKWLMGGATLISDDGDTILTIMQREGRLVAGGGAPLHAPPGRFYVAPGVFAADPIQLGLLDLIRAGVDLTDSGIPSVVLKEGEYGGSHEFDAVTMDRAIRREMQRHLKANGGANEDAPVP